MEDNYSDINMDISQTAKTSFHTECFERQESKRKAYIFKSRFNLVPFKSDHKIFKNDKIYNK